MSSVNVIFMQRCCFHKKSGIKVFDPFKFLMNMTKLPFCFILYNFFIYMVSIFKMHQYININDCYNHITIAINTMDYDGTSSISMSNF